MHLYKQALLKTVTFPLPIHFAGTGKCSKLHDNTTPVKKKAFKRWSKMFSLSKRSYFPSIFWRVVINSLARVDIFHMYSTFELSLTEPLSLKYINLKQPKCWKWHLRGKGQFIKLPGLFFFYIVSWCYITSPFTVMCF